VKRREFIAGLSSAAAWPIVARGQQQRDRDRVWRISVLMPTGEDDSDARAWLSGFTRGLMELGWADGRNVRVDVRWAGGNVDRMRIFAKELVDLQPDAVLTFGTAATRTLGQETQTIPIVFTSVGDAIGDGFVASLARPGGI
jgi:putative tryptophan/tyrosine transport system substrate-binding protein